MVPGQAGSSYRPPGMAGVAAAPAPVYHAQPGPSAAALGQPQQSLSAAPAPVYRPQASTGSAAPAQTAGPQSGGAPPPVFRPSQPAGLTQQPQSATVSAQSATGAAPPPMYRPQPQPAANGVLGGGGAPPPTYVPQAGSRPGSAAAPAPVYWPQLPAQNVAAEAPAPVYRPQPAAAAPPNYEPPLKKRPADSELQVPPVQTLEFERRCGRPLSSEWPLGRMLTTTQATFLALQQQCLQVESATASPIALSGCEPFMM